MENKILNFTKTEHFIKRQKERNIDDKLLIEALMNLEVHFTKRPIIVFPSGYYTRHLECLIVIVDGRELITLYRKSYINNSFSSIQFSNHLTFY